jgi:S1-C subfamily serine protease
MAIPSRTQGLVALTLLACLCVGSSAHPADEAAPSPQSMASESTPRIAMPFTISDGDRGARIDGISTDLVGFELLAPGDVVVAADGTRIRNAAALVRHLEAFGPGAAILLEVRRHGRVRAIGVQLPGRAQITPAPGASESPKAPGRPASSP